MWARGAAPITSFLYLQLRGSGGSSARVAQQHGSARSPSAFLPSKMSLLQQPVGEGAASAPGAVVSRARSRSPAPTPLGGGGDFGPWRVMRATRLAQGPSQVPARPRCPRAWLWEALPRAPPHQEASGNGAAHPATLCVLFPTLARVALPRNNPMCARWLLLPFLCSQHLLLWL